MELLPNNLKEIIDGGENDRVEFKESSRGIPSNLFETVCAMLNRNGGHIFLGIKDDKTVKGIDETKVLELKKNFVSLCNNPNKISPTIHVSIKEYIYQDKVILYSYIHESSDVHKSSNKIYDRNEDGDFDITNNTTMVSNMYIRKSNTYIENKIYPFAKLEDLRTDLIERARKSAVNRSANHPWGMMSDLDLLKSAGLYEKNYSTGEEGINLAGILLLGKDEVISSVLSYYKIDAILKIHDTERYDDRDDMKTNLLESYDRLILFVKKHINEKFFLEDGIRINVRDIIARELCANLLIHREYSNPYPAKLIIDKENITTENANKPRNIGYIDINNYSPYPKNPKIANFFKEIGIVEELGSGIKKIAKYSKIYSSRMPTFSDGEIFKAIVPYNDQIEEIGYEELRTLLLDFIISSNGCTRSEINNYFYPIMGSDKKKNNDRIRTTLTYLKNKSLIENIGSDTSPIWKVRKNI